MSVLHTFRLILVFVCASGANLSKVASLTELKLTDPAFVESYVQEARRRCPLCDSSVYDYCGDKLFHDSCCCNNPNNPYYPLPPRCKYADCSFLHANSCEEHKLITACCCLH